MCGRFTLTRPPHEVAAAFQVDAHDIPELAPRFNVAPGQAVATIDAAAGAGRRALRLRRWGLVPRWAADPGIGARLINARCESAPAKAAFREAFRWRRCLVPADGFYEWGAGAAGRQPYHVALADGGLFAIAGLWERWIGPDGAALESCALLTTQANERVREIHARMPVLLAPRDCEAWLDPARVDPAALAPLLRPFPAEALRLRAVSRRVNDARLDEASLLDPCPPARAPVQGALF